MGFSCCGMRSRSERLSRCPRSWRCGLTPAAGSCDRAAECLDDLVAAVADPELLVSAMRKTSPRWNEADDLLFRSVRPALSAVLEGLRTAGLAHWWAEHAEGDLQRRCGELRQSFAGYDLVPLVEQHTAVSFDARAVELCVLRWAAPHGIRVTGTRFLTDVRYEADRVLNIAVHELLHPPWPQGHPVKDRLDALAADPFHAARFDGRGTRMPDTTPGPATPRKTRPRRSTSSCNTRLGRNSRGDPVTRWTTADGGIRRPGPAAARHVAARRVSTPRSPATPISSPALCRTRTPGPAISTPGISN